MTHAIESTTSFVSPQERTRLVHFCAMMTRESEAAEDLAQETLLEAWRHLEGLRDPEKRSQWLTGIARNVCRRWRRQSSHDLAHHVPLEASLEQDGVIPEEAFADPFDIEVELERKELVVLLDRAMSALPPGTRTALVKHYVEETPLAEIGAQLGINVSTIAMRLQRGRLALRRVLTTRLQEEFASYDYQMPGRSDWEETRLWCGLCGQRRLLGKLDPENGSLELICPTCCHDSNQLYTQEHFPDLLSDVRGYKRALSRVETCTRPIYRAGLKTGSATCTCCGTLMPLLRLQPGEAPEGRCGSAYRRLCGSAGRHGIAFICPACESWYSSPSYGIVHRMPEAQRFLREHPRVRTLPEREIEVDGQLALVTSLESVTDSARFDMVTALDTYEILRIFGGERCVIR